MGRAAAARSGLPFPAAASRGLIAQPCFPCAAPHTRTSRSPRDGGSGKQAARSFLARSARRQPGLLERDSGRLLDAPAVSASKFFSLSSTEPAALTRATVAEAKTIFSIVKDWWSLVVWWSRSQPTTTTTTPTSHSHGRRGDAPAGRQLLGCVSVVTPSIDTETEELHLLLTLQYTSHHTTSQSYQFISSHLSFHMFIRRHAPTPFTGAHVRIDCSLLTSRCSVIRESLSGCGHSLGFPFPPAQSGLTVTVTVTVVHHRV